jgi:hypothetical protein
MPLYCNVDSGGRERNRNFNDCIAARQEIERSMSMRISELVENKGKLDGKHV